MRHGKDETLVTLRPTAPASRLPVIAWLRQSQWPRPFDGRQGLGEVRPSALDEARSASDFRALVARRAVL